MGFSFSIRGRTVKPGGPRLLIAGPCVIESESHAFGMAERIKSLTDPLRKHFIWVFKASYDKANRSSISSARGPGMEQGLRILQRIREELDVPVITDVHETPQVQAAADVVDVLQIPAFLCRQTDLLIAAGNSGRVVNIKKGQFVAPHDMGLPVEKVRSTGNPAVMMTERGTCFGYNNLVVDFAGFRVLRQFDAPLIFDATHSAQLPGGLGTRTGGRREVVPDLARAAAAVGVDGFFMEVHDNPDQAWSDAANQLTLEMFGELLPQLVEIQAIRGPLP